MNTRDTHVLIDEKGLPLVRGTLYEILDNERACIMAGIDDVSVKPIRAPQLHDD